MNKKINVLIWILAIFAVMIASYTVYTKNKPQSISSFSSPSVLTATVPSTSGPVVPSTSVPVVPPSSVPTVQSPSVTQAPSVAAPATSSKSVSEASSVPAVTSAPSTQSETAKTPAETDKILAPDFNLKDLNGTNVKLSDFKGKIVILNFWAVWCKYCKQEMPDLNELNQELAKNNDAVIIAVDAQESVDTVKGYLTSNNINLNVLLDQDGSVTQTYGITGFPTTFIINKDGSLYTYIPGATNKKTLLEIIDKAKKGEPVQ